MVEDHACEVFLLGIITAALSGGEHASDAAAAIGLRVESAELDPPAPFINVVTTRSCFADTPDGRQHFRIRVERAS